MKVFPASGDLLKPCIHLGVTPLPFGCIIAPSVTGCTLLRNPCAWPLMIQSDCIVLVVEPSGARQNRSAGILKGSVSNQSGRMNRN